jgi:hypothetical protein
MQTIDLREFVEYESSVGEKAWVRDWEGIDVEVVDVLQAAIDGHIPRLYTMSFLLENGELTKQQCDILASLIGARAEMPPAYKDGLSKSGILDMPRKTALDATLVAEELYRYARDYRPRATSAMIHMYLDKYIMLHGLAFLFDNSVDSSGETLEVEIEQFSNLTIRTFMSDGLSALKMAFYHFNRSRPVEETKGLLRELKKTVEENPPQYSDDYTVPIEV